MGDYLTTREAAEVLGSPLPRLALPVLQGAAIPHKRAGTAYLWERRAVERLAAALRDGTEAHGQGGDR